MKNVILSLIFCYFTFVAQGQSHNFFSDLSIKKKRIKSILVKVYENKVHRFNYKYYNYKRYFDTSGILIKEIVYKSNKDSIIHNFTYYIKDNLYIQVISSNIKDIPKDSTVAFKKNNSTFEIRRYLEGTLISYRQSILDSTNHTTKITNVSYNLNSGGISPILRFQEFVKLDTSVHTKIVHIDSTKTYVKEYFNNNKNNYSEGYIYYNKSFLVEKKLIKNFFPNYKESLNFVELHYYDDKKNPTKIFKLLQKDFELLQENPKAKVNLVDSDEYKYNDNGMLIEHILFGESFRFQTNINNNGFMTRRHIGINQKKIKLVLTYGYEYW